jgi:hypothetical protein
MYLAVLAYISFDLEDAGRRQWNATTFLQLPLSHTPSVSFYLSLDSVKLHYPAINKKKRREYLSDV